MEKIDDAKLLSCSFVSNLFEYSTKRRDCSSKTFVKAYLYSSIRVRTSSKDFLFDSLDVATAYEIIKKEKKLTRGKDIYPSFVMAWIGYIMKYFAYATGLPETLFYKKVKPEELYSLYEPYHSLDNDLAIRRICEAKGINTNLNDVELLKAFKL